MPPVEHVSRGRRFTGCSRGNRLAGSAESAESRCKATPSFVVS